MNDVQENILLLGDNPKYFWIGSSTLYIQQEYSNALGKKLPNAVHLFYPYQRRDILRYLFAPIRRKQKTHIIEINAGIVPLLYHCLHNKYSVIHCIVIRNYMVWIVLLAKFFRMPTILTLHDTIFITDPRISFSIFVKMIILKVVSGVIVFSKTDKERVNSFNPDLRYYFAKNGVNAISSYREITNNKIILFGGGLGSPNKGLDFLETSLQKIKRSVDLIICGSHAAGKTHPAFVGEVSREEFYKLIRSARIVIISSEFESFSMIALEALSLGTPIILTPNCGIAQYLIDGVDCNIIKYGDSTILAEKIDKLLSDDLYWQKLSQNGLKTAERFLWDNIIPEYVYFYKLIYQ
jgi:glycosyltransferase involved in cell wall biosynthesis